MRRSRLSQHFLMELLHDALGKDLPPRALTIMTKYVPDVVNDLKFENDEHWRMYFEGLEEPEDVDTDMLDDVLENHKENHTHEHHAGCAWCEDAVRHKAWAEAEALRIEKEELQEAELQEEQARVDNYYERCGTCGNASCINRACRYDQRDYY